MRVIAPPLARPIQSHSRLVATAVPMQLIRSSHTLAAAIEADRGSVVATSSCPLSTLASSGCGLPGETRPCSSSVSSRSTATVAESPAVPGPIYSQLSSQTHLHAGLSVARSGQVSANGLAVTVNSKTENVAEKLRRQVLCIMYRYLITP